MTKYISLLFVVFALAVTSSCVKDVDNIDLPENTPKLVVASFNSPTDTVHSLLLSWSRPIFGDDDPWYENFETSANVSISDGSTSYQMVYNHNLNTYLVDGNSHLFQEGKSYTLNVKVGDVAVSSETTVPVKPLYQLTHTRTSKSTTMFSTSYRHFFDFKIQNAEPINYYRIAMGKKQFGSLNLMADLYVKGEQGKEIMVDFESYGSEMGIGTIDSLTFEVYHCDKAFYNYHNSLRNYSGENPFAEPTIIYSNVDNGLGVFSSYQKDTKLVLIDLSK